jgi:hypothetical protein
VNSVHPQKKDSQNKTTTTKAAAASSSSEIKDQLRRLPLSPENLDSLANTMLEENLPLAAVVAAVGVTLKKKPDNPAGFVLAAARKGWSSPVSSEGQPKIVDPAKVKEALEVIYATTGERIGLAFEDHVEICRRGLHMYGEDAKDFLERLSHSISSQNLLIFMSHIVH